MPNEAFVASFTCDFLSDRDEKFDIFMLVYINLFKAVFMVTLCFRKHFCNNSIRRECMNVNDNFVHNVHPEASIKTCDEKALKVRIY